MGGINLEFGIWQTQTTTHKTGKRGPTAQHRELYPISYYKPKGKEYEKEHIYTRVCVYN